MYYVHVLTDLRHNNYTDIRIHCLIVPGSWLTVTASPMVCCLARIFPATDAVPVSLLHAQEVRRSEQVLSYDGTKQ